MNKQEAIKRLSSIEDETKELRKIIEAKDDLFTIIKNSSNKYKEVCKQLGRRELKLTDFEFLPENQRLKAYYHQRIQNIKDLFNGDWKEKFDGKQQNWYLWLNKTGLGWVFDSLSYYNPYSCAVAYYKDKQTSHFVGVEFLDEYINYIEA